MKTSIPKLYSIKYKQDGLRASNVKIHPDKHEDLAVLKRELTHVIDSLGRNMSYSEIVGVLEFVKLDQLLPE